MAPRSISGYFWRSCPPCLPSPRDTFLPPSYSSSDIPPPRPLQLHVADYYAGLGSLPVPPRANVLLATVEKGALVVQSLSEQGRLGELVAVSASAP
jgi:hypothetical protein